MKIGVCPECGRIQYLIPNDGICLTCKVKDDDKEAEDKSIQSRIAKEIDEGRRRE